MIFRYLFLTCFLAVSCGSDKKEKKVIKSSPTDKTWTAEIKPILKARCVRCHASSEFISSGAAYKRSGASKRVASGNMPPVGSGEAASMTAAEKTTLINYQ
jgi:hypothetical protein